MISHSICITDDSQKTAVQLFVNGKNEVCIAQVDEFNDSPFAITISKSDWDAIVKFVTEEYDNKPF
jgi:hypothetical protein